MITAVATTSATSVDEGQPFRLDASGSTTTSGAALSYVWTQTGGPAVTIANPATAALDLTAPELTASATATFRVTVTSGANSAQANVDVNLANIAQTPVHTTLTLGQTEVLPYPIANLMGFLSDATIGLYAPFLGGNITFVGASVDANGDVTVNTKAFAGNFAPDKTHFSTTPWLPFDPNPSSFKYNVLEEGLNRFWVYSFPFPATPVRGLTIEKPCTVSWDIFGVYIGQRSKGFSLMNGNLVKASVDSGKSFCALIAPDYPVSGEISFDGPSQNLRDVLAIDTDTNTIYHYAPPTDIASTYVLKETVPVQLDTAANVKLVAQAEIGPTPFGRALALAYTDGEHRGVHRLVVLGLDAQRNIVQETRSWPVGVPAALLYEDLDRDNHTEVAVITSTSPQAVVFEASTTNPAFTSLEVLPLSDARCVEIGLGATTAVTSLDRVFGYEALYVGYRDRKEVRALLLPDN